ncbi:hypothetical protein [Bacillus pinisoli]|uniref:hypothetical protein n=1 Tax=Bacillus pinisoli TaxID=2901866 RepID=UPI001FF50694|nr:hypothetical protein [Bacillus pinisoli]
MQFVVFFFISWLVIALYSVVNKKLNVIESTFIFLVVLIVSINFSWIVINELHLITVSKQKLAYTGFLLNRSIIIPLLVLLAIDLTIKMNKPSHKVLVFISLVSVLNGLSLLSTSLGVTDFKNWNLLYESIYFVCLGLIALASIRILNKISKDVVKKNDAMGNLR